jgi:hypothetical protein
VQTFCSSMPRGYTISWQVTSVEQNRDNCDPASLVWAWHVLDNSVSPFSYRTSASRANGGNLLCVELCCCPTQLYLVILVYRVTCPENIEKEVFRKVFHALAMLKEAIAWCCLSCLWMTLKASSQGCHEGRSPLKHDKFNITEFFTLKWPATEHSLLCSCMHRSEYAMPSRVSPML